MPDEKSTESDCYPFFVSGKVVKGFGRGSSELGIPTANIDHQIVKNINLPTGIYFGWSQLTLTEDQFNQLTKDQQDKLKPILNDNGSNLVSPIYMMSTALGYNPYYDNKEKALEIHILNKFDCDLYGVTINSLICGKIRDEKNYDNLESLIEAINNDIKETREKLSLDCWLTVKSNDQYFIQS